MALNITHTFVSAKADGADATQVRPSNWNASHTITGTTDTVQTVVPSGATVTVNLALGNIVVVQMNAALTINVSGIATSGRYVFVIEQGTTGNYNVTWNAAFHGAMVVTTGASTATPSTFAIQEFISFDGTTLYPLGAGVTNVA